MRILLAEDNADLAKGLRHALGDEGHSVDHFDNGDDADTHLAADGADLIILDIGLPGIDGLEVLRRLRARSDLSPVLLLTARGATDDRVRGLDAGADDYLVKPFATDELLARLRALMRRRARGGDPTETIGQLRFDRGGRRVFSAAGDLDLPRRELSVFECLVDRRGRITSKSALADHVYGAGADVEDKVMEVYVSRLRKRLKPFGLEIKMARGLGYLLEGAG